MNILETKRLILRTWQDDDLEPMTAINQDPKVMEYFPSIQDRDSTYCFIECVKKHQEQHGFSLYALALKPTGEMIGFVGLQYAQFNAHFTPAVEVGWRLAFEHWKKGYATEAAQAVLHYAFTQLDLDEIVSFTTSGNIASQRVMEKIGLHHNKKDDFDHPKLSTISPLCRHVLYRITKQEYLAKSVKNRI